MHIIIITTSKKIYIVSNQLLYYNMDQTKLAQQLFNLTDEIYCSFYHNVFLQVCSAYSIIPDGFTVNKNLWDWEGELINVESKWHNLVPYEYVEKLFKSEDTFNCLLEELLIWGLATES